MCNTVPNVIKKLSYKTYGPFSRRDLLAALVNDGYGVEKAERRVTAAILSKQIVPCPDMDDGEYFISIYCPMHWEKYAKELEEVEIIPIKIDRDGRPVKARV